MPKKAKPTRSAASTEYRKVKTSTYVLSLNLRREFFDAILAGIKRTKYREYKDY